MGVYRIEIASSGRAICKNTECKKNQVKIPKGDLRFCTQVDINGKQSWTYKHWGCTTPQQIQNLKNSIEDKIDYLDGFDELPSELQAKVLKALEDGHVDDDDWKGDPEQNRPGRTKFRSPAVKKHKSEGEEEEDGHESPVSKKPVQKKRGRAKKGEASEQDDQTEPPIKKARVASKKDKSNNATETKVAPETGALPIPKRPAKGKKADANLSHELTTGEQENSPSDSERQLQPKKKRPQRKAAASRKVIADENEDEIESDRYEEQEEDAEPKPTKSRKKKAAENSSGIKATASKKSKKTKAAEDPEKPTKPSEKVARTKLR